jgi:hypothetical protein
VKTTCPICGNPDCIVRESFVQATRYEGPRSLGFQGFCPSCDMHFRVTAEMVQESFT